MLSHLALFCALTDVTHFLTRDMTESDWFRVLQIDVRIYFFLKENSNYLFLSLLSEVKWVVAHEIDTKEL